MTEALSPPALKLVAQVSAALRQAYAESGAEGDFDPRQRPAAATLDDVDVETVFGQGAEP